MLSIKIITTLFIGCGSLLAGVSLGNEVPCLEVEVTGASSQTDINGRYLLDESFDQQCSGRQSWTRNVDTAGKSAFIYYLEDGYDGWVIAKSSCTSWGNFFAMVKTDSQTPFDLAESWKEYDAQGPKSAASTSLKVSCTKRSVDHCARSTCSNGATCVNRVKDFKCLCTEKFTGHLCDSSVTGDSRLYTLKLTLAVIFITIAVTIAVTVTCIIYRRRQQLKRRMDDVSKEVHRNVHSGQGDYQYKPLDDTLSSTGGDAWIDEYRKSLDVKT